MSGSTMGGLPKGWVDYHAVGRVIPHTRIVAFKTPLKRELHEARSDDPALDRFTPQDCIRAVRKTTHGRKRLGLVLNLTFTTKYYNPHDFEREGVHYGAIKCPGHEIPNDELFASFQRSLYEYFWDYPDMNQVVGVHCTHGVNRTGYMIARFLIQCEGWDVEEAISTVGDSRGFPIERENYVAHLHNLHMPSYRFPKVPTAKDRKETAERRQTKNSNSSVSQSGHQLGPPTGADHSQTISSSSSNHDSVEKTGVQIISNKRNHAHLSVGVNSPETESRTKLLTESKREIENETHSNISITSNGEDHIQLSEDSDSEEFIPLFNIGDNNSSHCPEKNKGAKRQRLS